MGAMTGLTCDCCAVAVSRGMGDESRDMGLVEALLPRGMRAEGEGSGSVDVRGDIEPPRDEGRDDTEEGRDWDA